MTLGSNPMDPSLRLTILGGETTLFFHGSKTNQWIKGGPSSSPKSIIPGFHQPVHHQNRQAQPTLAFQAPTQVPASSSQPTLEESLRVFMQITGQSISEVKSAMMVNTQAIAKLEVQMGQMAKHLGEREKGKLPS
jgi:hypothetical protein